MRLHHVGVTLVLALALGLAGCDGADGLLQPDAADTQADVQAGAMAAAIAGPSADLSGELILTLVDSITPSAARLTSAAGPRQLAAHGCPSSFELENGISGTCAVSPDDVVTFVFGGTVLVDGGEVALEGTLVVAQAVEQPESGTIFTVDFDATAAGPRGSATWSVSGLVTLDEAGEVVAYSFSMSHTVTPSGGATAVVTVVLDATRFELVVTGPHGGVLRFVLDRASMSGFVTLNGFQVAVVTIEDGCTHVDYVLPELDDRTVCSAG